jgi:predicted nuclease with RNAse H fold
VGLDGPVRPDLTLTTRGRACERRLLRAPFHRHCKPGSTAAPMGQRLHAEATRLARAIAQTHPGARVVEAFPSAFLRTLLSEDAVGRIPRHCKSQVYWERCVADGVLARLVADLYGTDAPSIMARLTALTHRDQRAAAICALTATSAGRGDAVEVGDAEDGWISLAPRPFLADWARAAL